MPPQDRTFEITGPDGRTVEINGPREPTEAELKQIWKELPTAAAASSTSPSPTTAPSFGLEKATSIHAPTWRERLLEVTPWLSYVGGGVGGFFGGIPGAALGAAGGKGWEIAANTLITGKLPNTGVMGNERTPTTSRIGGAARETGRSAVEMGTSAITAGVLPEAGGGLLQGGFLRPVAGSLDAKLFALDRGLKLRLTTGEVAASTPAGIVAQTVENISQRSFGGQLIGKMQQRLGRLSAIEGMTDGGVALKRVGQELDAVIKAGPTVDLLPEKLAAVKIANEQIFPKVLQLKSESIPKPLQAELQVAMRGGLAPSLTHKLLKRIHPILAGKGQPLPVGSVDTLLRILDASDDLTFEAATNLRTGMMEVGAKGDALLGERGTALAREYTKQLTTKLEQLQPEWRALTTQYRRGIEGLKEKPVAQLGKGLSLTERDTSQGAVRARSQQPGPTPLSNVQAIDNVRLLNEALQRKRQLPWARLYEAFELASIAGATYKGGPAAGAYTALTLEALPSLIVWASYSPAMKQYLMQGFTAPSVKVATANFMRVAEGYQAWRQSHQRSSEGQEPIELPDWAK